MKWVRSPASTPSGTIRNLRKGAVIDDKKIAAKVKKDFEEWTSQKNLSQGTVTWR